MSTEYEAAVEVDLSSRQTSYAERCGEPVGGNRLLLVRLCQGDALRYVDCKTGA
jgi:hypothetical protein